MTRQIDNKEEVISEKAERKVVVPGEVIVVGEDYLPGDGARREGEKVVSSRFGLAEIVGRVIRVLSLFGTFIPRRGNVVIGRVTDVTFRGWVVDVDAAAAGFLALDECPRFINPDEMDRFLGIGDIVSAKIWNVKTKGSDLTLDGKGLGKLEGGFIFRVIPSRVPRIIGREGSMVGLIKEKTGCQITIGQNGWIWIKGNTSDAEIRARKAIEFVADKVLVEGLTEKMEAWFEKNK
jgi:exosome complex component RRP4